MVKGTGEVDLLKSVIHFSCFNYHTIVYTMNRTSRDVDHFLALLSIPVFKFYHNFAYFQIYLRNDFQFRDLDRLFFA